MAVLHVNLKKMLVLCLFPSILSIIVKTLAFRPTIIMTPKSHVATFRSIPLLDEFFFVFFFNRQTSLNGN